MKRIFAILLLSVNIICSYSQVTQSWMKRYDGPSHNYDFGHYIEKDVQGNIYMVGTSYGTSTSSDILTLKLNPNGDLLWQQTYRSNPGNRMDVDFGLKVDAAGNCYVIGATEISQGQVDMVIIKYNTLGEQVWLKLYNGTGSGYDTPGDIALDNNCNLYITGRSYGSTGQDEMITHKYDSTGALIWSSRLESDLYTTAGGEILIDETGSNIYVTGSRLWNPVTYQREIFTVKYNGNGDTMWTKKIRGDAQNNDGGYELSFDNTGNIILAGITENVMGRDDITVAKYTPSGQQLWLSKYNYSGTDADDNVYKIRCDSFGNTYLAGSRGPNYANDYLLQKYNSAGQIIWTRFYGTVNENDVAFDMAIDNAGDIYVTGQSKVTGQDYNIVTIKYDSSGSQLWLKEYNNPNGNGIDVGTKLLVDNTGNIFVTGFSFNTGSEQDAVVIKYSPSLTTLEPISSQTPAKYSLYQNYPNPFNPSTNIKFSIPEKGNVTMKVFDLQGKEVAVLVNEFKSAGSYSIDFNASHLSSGVYFYKIQTSDFTDVKKMVLIK